jgi:hypothetical protein
MASQHGFLVGDVVEVEVLSTAIGGDRLKRGQR